MSAKPAVIGCSIKNTTAFPGNPIYPKTPFCDGDVAATAASDPTNATFMNAIRVAILRRIVVTAFVTTPDASTNFLVKNPSGANAFVLNIDPSAHVTPFYIEFPGDGLRFPHGIGIDINDATLYYTIFYDAIF